MGSMTVTWTRMADGSKSDFEILQSRYFDHADNSLVDSLVATLRMMEGPKLGYRIDRYQHSLQSATRALRNGESDEFVVAALLHDIGDVLAPHNHSAVAAAVLAPYVSETVHGVIAHHGLFQGYYYFHHLGGDRNARDRYKASPHYDACVDFCESYDQNCFDPHYPTLQIEDFEPLLREVLAQPRPEHAGVPDPGPEA